MSSLPISRNDDVYRRVASAKRPARALLDIGALDVRIQERIAQLGSIKDFQTVLWRDTPDATGCNWDARIRRLPGSAPTDSRWWDLVVAQMRESFNLA
jgi:hypothetical protein